MDKIEMAAAESAKSSDSPAARMAARRQRIFERQNENEGILPEIKSSVCTEPPRKSRDQVTKSGGYLDEVIRDTGRLLANVRTESLTCDADQNRRMVQARSRRLEVLERESKVAQQQLKDISKNGRTQLNRRRSRTYIST